jgi:CBS domain-containing protein
MPVNDLIQKMLNERHLGYPVIDHSGRLIGVVDLEHAQEVTPETTVGDIMIPEMHTITPQKSAIDAFSSMSRNNYRRLVVVDESGEIVGVLSKTDLVRVIQVRMVGVNLVPEIADAPKPEASGRGWA